MVGFVIGGIPTVESIGRDNGIPTVGIEGIDRWDQFLVVGASEITVTLAP